jgi:putative transposase
MPAGRPRDEAQAIHRGQIIGILKEAEAGAKSTDLCRRHAISEQTFYRWKAKYAGLEVNEARRLRTLEHETPD